MKSANKEKLLSFFQNNYQYEIPFFQRSYVWDEENWQLLLEHLEEEVEAHDNKKKSEHFIGTIITKPIPQDGFNTTSLELIDGQQRLTTIAIMLKALADTSIGDFSNLKDNLLKYLVFYDSQDNDYYRIKHSRNDSPYFERIMKVLKDGERIENERNKINEAYFFYLKAFKHLSDSQRDKYANVLLNKMPVIAMFLSEEDDEQEIFDTINSLGVRLTVSELLKNYIFREVEIRELYEEYWFSVFEEDDEVIEFWNTDKTAGRIKRTNLELLLYCYLIIETGKDVRIEKLFMQYKNHLKNKDKEYKKEFLGRLKECALIYNNFPTKKQFNEIAFTEVEKRVFHVIENIEVTTVYPLLLTIYQKVEDATERNKILSILESYLVRRMMVRLTVKNYNRLFIQIINDFKNDQNISAKSFAEKLMSYKDETNRFPNDDEFKESFHQTLLYNRYVREILFMIALHKLSNSYSDVSKLSSNSYSVEHMMPKKWREHWLDKKMTDDEKSKRDWILKRLGNLTLVTQPLNSKLKNSAWDNKKKELKKYSSLSITTDYLELDSWDETQIKNRANNLSEEALNIWKSLFLYL